MDIDDGAAGWVAEACTLPTAQRPTRVAEFDALFRTALRGRERRSATWLRLALDPDCEPLARDLTDRETRCCSFFTFTFDAGPEVLTLDVQVPAAHTDILDALAARAATTEGSAQ